MFQHWQNIAWFNAIFFKIFNESVCFQCRFDSGVLKDTHSWSPVTIWLTISSVQEWLTSLAPPFFEDIQKIPPHYKCWKVLKTLMKTRSVHNVIPVLLLAKIVMAFNFFFFYNSDFFVNSHQTYTCWYWYARAVH